MKITKLGHSCVLVNIDGVVALYDPGVWSDLELIQNVEKVDEIVYTHEHADHFDINILQNLIEKHPKAITVCNQEIKEKIIEAKLDVVIKEETENTIKFLAPHEQLPIPGSQAPSENGYHFKDQFSSPGDSHSFNETKKVLALPVIAPWGKTGDAVDLALKLKPEYILPVHDWHYTEEARKWLESLLKSSLEPSGIKVLSSEPGLVHDL